MTTKTVYLFDELTGEYQGTYEAHESPLEQGVFHAPVHSTPKQPPVTQANEAAIFTADEWTIVPDFRGKVLYDQTTGETVEHNTLCEIPAHLGLELPPAIVAKKAEADARAERDARITAVTWRYERNAREARLGIKKSDDIATLDKYVQALADVPKQKGFPDEIKWPTL